jgi:hypothetical protein
MCLATYRSGPVPVGNLYAPQEVFEPFDPWKLTASIKRAKQAVSGHANALRVARTIGRAYWANA